MLSSDSVEAPQVRHPTEVALEFERDDGLDEFDAQNSPCPGVKAEIVQQRSSTPTTSISSSDSEFSSASQEEFLRRYEALKSCLTDPYCPLSQRGAAMYGETTTYSEVMVVLFGGRVVLGPQYIQMLATIVLSAVPPALTASFGKHVPVALHVLTWVSWSLVVVMLLWTSVVNPGIVPKRMESLQPNPPRARVLIGDYDATLRYCSTCDVYRGPRTHHCGICENCVDQYDHHCPWTGTCIGAKNYHAFLYFLHVLHILAALCVTDAIVATVDASRSLGVSISDSLLALHYLPVVVVAFVFVAGFSVTGLLLFHWFLLVRNLTTAEFLKATYEDGESPWTLGSAWANAYAKFKGVVDERMYSQNFACLVVRELVRRELQQLDQEREEERRLRKDRRQRSRVPLELRSAAAPIDGETPAFAAAPV